MGIWLIICGAGVLITATIMVDNLNNSSHTSNLKKKSYITGILIPLMFAFFYSETLIKNFPGITVIDLGAFLIIGMISGFYMALYTITKSYKKPATDQPSK